MKHMYTYLPPNFILPYLPIRKGHHPIAQAPPQHRRSHGRAALSSTTNMIVIANKLHMPLASRGSMRYIRTYNNTNMHLLQSQLSYPFSNHPCWRSLSSGSNESRRKPWQASSCKILLILPSSCARSSTIYCALKYLMYHDPRDDVKEDIRDVSLNELPQIHKESHVYIYSAHGNGHGWLKNIPTSSAAQS